MRTAIILLSLATLLAAQAPPLTTPDSTAKADSAAVRDSLRIARQVESGVRRANTQLGIAIVVAMTIALGLLILSPGILSR